MRLGNIGARLENAVSLFQPSKNHICSSNKGIRALLYGKDYGGAYKLGLMHILTAARFRSELLAQRSLRGRYGDSVAEMSGTIRNSIPNKYRKAFLDISYLDYFIDSPETENLAKIASSIRKKYDFFIDKPIAKVRSGIYFGWHNIKDSVTGLFRNTKANDVDLDFVKQIFPSYIKIPEGATKEELKKFVITTLKKCNYSDKEIEAVLERKSPIFYRFVNETELRAVKNGRKITSAAEYNIDAIKTDITSNPNYSEVLNKYRITFKINPNWNPFKKDENSLVSHNEINLKTWKLSGGYGKKDILCTERVR